MADTGLNRRDRAKQVLLAEMLKLNSGYITISNRAVNLPQFHVMNQELLAKAITIVGMNKNMPITEDTWKIKSIKNMYNSLSARDKIELLIYTDSITEPEIEYIEEFTGPLQHSTTEVEEVEEVEVEGDYSSIDSTL